MDALIVASTAKQQHALSDVLHTAKIDSVICSTAAEARRASLCRPFDLFVINGGLSDEDGHDLATDLAGIHDCGGVYIDEFAKADMFEDDLANVGVITLVRPITKSSLYDAVRLLSVANLRVASLKKKNYELSSKLEDMKYITRAKIALMRSLGLTEEQAHKYIEKKSMDMRISRRKVAIDILKTYEAI